MHAVEESNTATILPPRPRTKDEETVQSAFPSVASRNRSRPKPKNALKVWLMLANDSSTKLHVKWLRRRHFDWQMIAGCLRHKIDSSSSRHVPDMWLAR
jgi:hypothetical protein